MAADQRKKRVNASTLVGCTSRDQNRAKRKRLEPPQHNMKTRPNISLQWDSKKKGVVSKRDQIGISQRHLVPFVERGPQGHNILADVLSVPQEIFQLKNLSEVLSFEVWESHFTEKERSFLSQFLPKEADPDTVVHDLLAGNNFHFGNPFLNWGTSLCSGALHPDNVLQEEQSMKANKNAYHVDVRKYHDDMIENLQAWKEKWLSSNDPEVDVVQNMWRSRKQPKKSLPPPETRFYDAEENHVATPESNSFSEKAYSSDNQNVGILPGESQSRKRLLNKKSDSSSSGLKLTAPPRQGGPKVHRRNIQREDGAKYMSYIKVSKKQHDRVKSSMKHSGNSIQPRSLNNVLGSIDTLNVQPFERFEEEEKKKLHNYWLKLARDIPECFAAWRNRQVKRQQITWTLAEELKEKVEQVEVSGDEGEGGSGVNLADQSNDKVEENLPVLIIEGAEKEQSDCLLMEQMGDESAACETGTDAEVVLLDEKETVADYKFDEQTHNDTLLTEDEEEEEDGGGGGGDDNDDVTEDVFVVNHNQEQIASVMDCPRVTAVMEQPNPVFLQDQHQQIPSLSNNPQVSSMIQSHRSTASAKTDGDPVTVSEYSGNLNRVDISVSQGGHPLPSNVWPAGDHVHGSYYQCTTTSATNDGYASTQEISLGHPQFIHEGPVQILDTESNRQQGKDVLLRRQANHDMPFFNTYSNQDRNSELLQSLFVKGQNSLSYRPEQKQPSLQFQSGNDMMIDAGQLPKEQMIHPSFPVDTRQKRINDLYLHQNIQNNVYSSRGRYNSMMPRQEQLGVNVHDWNSLNTVRMPVPLSQPQLSNAPQLSQNSWYDIPNNARDGWPSSFEGGGGHGFSSGGSSNSDQSLFSVLSECNDLRPGTSYNNNSSMGSSGRFIQGGANYSGVGVGIPIPSGSSNMLHQQSGNPLNYLSGHEPPPAAMAVTAGLKLNNNNLGWMGLPPPPQQNSSGIQDSSMGKPPFLRSWNQ